MEKDRSRFAKYNQGKQHKMSQFFKQNKLQTALKLCYILDLPGFYFFRGVRK